jgi:hypothetical protein
MAGTVNKVIVNMEIKHINFVFIFSEPEPQVMDYQAQQHKLFLQLASAYAFWFAGQHMQYLYITINDEVQSGNVDLLPEVCMCFV